MDVRLSNAYVRVRQVTYRLRHTFREFATVKLASLELDSDDVSEGLVEKFDGDTETCCGHFCE